MRIILLSDIHGNLSALNAVIDDFSNKYSPDGIILLGDIINYGMRPNEVIDKLEHIELPIFVNIFGNHEKALLDGDTSHFSTERGKKLLDYTRSILNYHTIDYIKNNCDSKGFSEFEIDKKKILVIHGSLSNPYWGKMNDSEMNDSAYSNYDYVLSGHSHIPHLVEKFYECDAPAYRNKKRTVFLNPGSVGQPRNHNPRAQYLYIDIESEIFKFNSVSYDIEKERSLYNQQVDEFYSLRLINGI